LSRAVFSAKYFEGFVLSQAVIEKGRKGQETEQRDGGPPRPTLDQPLLVVPEDDEADGQPSKNSGQVSDEADLRQVLGFGQVSTVDTAPDFKGGLMSRIRKHFNI
jgi:hypothetical protein